MYLYRELQPGMGGMFARSILYTFIASGNYKAMNVLAIVLYLL